MMNKPIESVALSLKLPSYSYGVILALKQISSQFEKGSLTAIVGPNGGGKSTFLKILAGLYIPKSGTVTRNISSPAEMAYLPQHHELDRTFPFLAKDVVMMGLWPQGKEKASTISSILDRVGLAGFEKRSISALSGGQFQRLLFARLVAQDADVILLDEPFAGIDQATVRDLLSLLHTWHHQGKTILVVLHDLAIVRNHFPQTLILSQEVIAHGPTGDVLTLENLTKATFHV